MVVTEGHASAQTAACAETRISGRGHAASGPVTVSTGTAADGTARSSTGRALDSDMPPPWAAGPHLPDPPRNPLPHAAGITYEHAAGGVGAGAAVWPHTGLTSSVPAQRS